MQTDVGAIWTELATQLRGFIGRRVTDPDDVEDILQEVLLRIHRQGDTLEQAERLYAWVYRIARNAIVDYYRERGRHAALAATLADEPPAVTSDTPPADLRAELAACLAPLVDRLPVAYRQALVLTEVQGLTQQAAARQLGLSLPGTKSRVQRARQQLKAMILECCRVEFDRRGGITAYEARDASCLDCQPDDHRV